MSGERWVLASDDELPERFTDPRCADFRCICSNGFEGPLALSSAFMHRPSSWPQCFPNGPDTDAVCTSEVIRRALHPEESDPPAAVASGAAK